MTQFLWTILICIGLSQIYGFQQNAAFRSNQLQSRMFSMASPPVLHGHSPLLGKSSELLSFTSLVARASLRRATKIIVPQRTFHEKFWDTFNVIMHDPIRMCFVAICIGITYTSIEKFLGFMRRVWYKWKNPKTEMKLQPGFEIYECESCQMQMRPSKGRARTVLKNARFRCPRCNGSGKRYFDINDFSDPRALQRAERLKLEQGESDYEEDE